MTQVDTTAPCAQCEVYRTALEELRRATFPLAASIDILSLAVPRMLEAGQAIKDALLKSGVTTGARYFEDPPAGT